MHYKRVWRHGDPTVVKVSAGTFRVGHEYVSHGVPQPRGAASPRWSGDECSYAAAHSRVRALKGSPSQHQCACGATARDWAYDHSDPAERRDASDRPYSCDPSRYVPMCRRCHRGLDRG